MIDEYFWKIIEGIVKAPLNICKILPWECDPLPFSWVEFIRSGQKYAHN